MYVVRVCFVFALHGVPFILREQRSEVRALVSDLQQECLLLSYIQEMVRSSNKARTYQKVEQLNISWADKPYRQAVM